MTGQHVLLIVSGGIAAYKSLELVRLLRKADCSVTCVLTESGARFVTPLSLEALSEQPGLHRSVRADRKQRHGAYPIVARRRSAGGGAGLRRSAGADGSGDLR